MTAQNAHSKVYLYDMTFDLLEKFILEELHLKHFRAIQIWQWIWAKNVQSFDAMSNISPSERVLLQENANISLPEIVTVRKSSDGTVKFLLRLSDGELIETVLIPSEAPKRENDVSARMTQCISTQVGCPMGCTFCSTGQLGFKRNLTSGEILAQIQIARHYLNDTRPEHPIIRNVVYMGMGEPFLNLKNVMNSLRILEHPKGLAFSPRRATVSTCGISSGIEEFGESGLGFLAVSLHAPNQQLREKLMPGASKLDLENLIEKLEKYPLKTRERVTLEYLVIHNINDLPEHVRQLSRICARLKAKLNLIPYNQTPNSPYTAPTAEELLEFEKKLWSKGITAIVRKSRGQDIEAACGQLKAEYIRQS